MPITILIADDHPVVRMGLRTLLEREPDCRVVAEADDGVAAVSLAEQCHPDILILDLMMPGRNGMDVIDEIVRQAPSTRVIVLSMHCDRAYVDEAFRRGARGYVAKDSLGERIQVAVRTVMTGGQFIAEAPPVAPYGRTAPAAPVRPLTPREREILASIAKGMSNKEIALHLSISVRTVETHRSRIMHKLELKSHAALIRFALHAQTAAPS